MKRIVLTFILMAVIAGCSPHRSEKKVSCKIWFDYPGETLPEDFGTLGEPDESVEKNGFNLDGYAEDSLDHFASLMTSELYVMEASDYVFILTSDDGSRFYVDGELLIDNDGSHSTTSLTGKVALEKGWHDLRVEYFEFTDGQSLNLMYGPEGGPFVEFGGHGPDAKMPAFVMDQAVETYRRFKAWKGDDEVAVFPILTDVHTNQRYTYQHIGYVAATDRMFQYDFMALLGDIGLNIGPGRVSKDYVRYVIDNTVAEMAKFEGVFLYAAGNHDWDAGVGDFHTSQFLSDTFQKPALKYAEDNLHLVPGKVYCWYDLPGKDMRVIMLNSEGTETQDGCYYIFDEGQLAWLRQLLEDTDEHTAVVIMSHYMPHPIGRWHNTPTDYTRESNEALMSLLSEYAAKRNIVGLFCGDSHVNVTVRENGVNYFLTQGYGQVSKEDMMEGTSHAFFDYRQSLCCDVIAVKLSKNEVHTFRIGAGGEEYDFQFTY